MVTGMDYEFDNVRTMELKRKMRRMSRRINVFTFAIAVIAWIPQARDLGLWGSLKLWAILLPALVFGCWFGGIRAMSIAESLGRRSGGSPKKNDAPPPGKEHILARALTRTPRGK